MAVVAADYYGNEVYDTIFDGLIKNANEAEEDVVEYISFVLTAFSSGISDELQKPLITLPPKRGRILCLSGHASTTDITKIQTNHLQLQDVHGFELSYLDGPFQTDTPFDPLVRALVDGPFYTWCPPGKDRYQDKANLMEGIEHVLAHVAREGPFDGIYGFSMGALVAKLAGEVVDERASMGHSALPQWDPESFQNSTRLEAKPWKFMIAACAQCLDNDTSKADTVPSLHLIGSQDPIADRSRKLAANCSNPSVHEMPYASHSLPTNCMEDRELDAKMTEFFYSVQTGCPVCLG
jgi:hypothetical protein